MKLFDFMRDGENLGWCKPYASDDGRFFMVSTQNGFDLMVDGEVFPLASDEVLDDFAKRVNPENYDHFKQIGRSADEIAIDAMREKGCRECPFKDECDAMVLTEEQKEHFGIAFDED